MDKETIRKYKRRRINYYYNNYNYNNFTHYNNFYINCNNFYYNYQENSFLDTKIYDNNFQISLLET